MNVMFERGSARDPRRSPLSAKFDEASAWRIGVPVAQFAMTLFYNDSFVLNDPEQNVFWTTFIIVTV